MSAIPLTRELAQATSYDAANRSMRAGNRKAWNEEDALVAVREFDRLWPLCEHGIEPEYLCYFCDQDRIPAGHPLKQDRKHPLQTREVTFKKAPRSRPEAAQNLTLNLGDN